MDSPPAIAEEPAAPTPSPRLPKAGPLDMPTSQRIASLDQFRGYTVAGMLLVNFLGGFVATPAWLKHHHTYCSYADTIMPQFLLAVGFGYRLSLRRRLAIDGGSGAYRHVVGRCIGLIALGLVIYHLDGRARTWSELRELGLVGFFREGFQRSPFQTLVHIALTSIWVLPVMSRPASWRVAYMLASAALFGILSWAFYFDWAWTRPVIDGGQLAFLTWSIPLLVGSLAYDAVSTLGPSRAWWRLTLASAGLMILGYALSCVGPVLESPGGPPGAWLASPPFMPSARPVDLWTMSQRTGSVSYLTFSAGFGLAVYVLFLFACDLGGLRLGLFGTFGRNALLAYVLHEMVAAAVKPYAPWDAPGWYVAGAFALYFGVTFLFVRRLDRDGIYIRL